MKKFIFIGVFMIVLTFLKYGPLTMNMTKEDNLTKISVEKVVNSSVGKQLEDKKKLVVIPLNSRGSFKSMGEWDVRVVGNVDDKPAVPVVKISSLRAIANPETLIIERGGWYQYKATKAKTNNPFVKVDMDNWGRIAIVRDIKAGYVLYDFVYYNPNPWFIDFKGWNDRMPDQPAEVGKVYEKYDWHNDGDIRIARVARIDRKKERVYFNIGPQKPHSTKLDVFESYYKHTYKIGE